MDYFSTNQRAPVASLETAVLQGLAPDGGLYMPAYFEQLPASFFSECSSLSFQEIAYLMARQLLQGDLPDSDLEHIINSTIQFDAPLVQVDPDCFALELFHGPTLAFKDFGARFMARLLSYYMQRREEKLTILVATSGDTGSAVAHGFFNTPNIRVLILYPQGKVSPLQEKQLTTMGGNITALEVAGSFDDCQRLVKEAFVDESLRKQVLLSSANSINIARLIPQSFYYTYAYSRLPDQSIPAVFSIPSGNFGNLTGGLFARKLGLPVDRFIAATNINAVVPEFLSSGVYAPRASRPTISNAMDVGDPSNYARLSCLFEGQLKRFQAVLAGYYFTDAETKTCMKSVFDKSGYILDPHGAIGYLGYRRFAESQVNEVQGIFLETAHPAKFREVVEGVLEQEMFLPERLARYAGLQKNSIKIAASYQDLKANIL